MSTSHGKLILVPNTLDFGASQESDLQDVLALDVIRTAANLGFWVTENAKTTRAFLKRVSRVAPLRLPIQSLQIVELPRPIKGARPGALPDLKPLLQPAIEGHDIGLISEAGLPAVADPGAALVLAAHEMSINVIPLSGPCSLVLALAASGLNGQSFAFVGYLPVDANERANRIRELETFSRRAAQTQLMIETPYRNKALLDALLSQLKPNTLVSVSCGLTLPTAWTRTDKVAAWQAAPTQMPADIPAIFSMLAF